MALQLPSQGCRGRIIVHCKGHTSKLCHIDRQCPALRARSVDPFISIKAQDALVTHRGLGMEEQHVVQVLYACAAGLRDGDATASDTAVDAVSDALEEAAGHGETTDCL